MRSAKQIQKSIVAVAKMEGSLRGKLQALGVEIIEHVKEHGDTSLMTHLYVEMGGSSRYRAELSAWFRNFTGTSIRLDEHEKPIYSFKKGVKKEDVDLEGAKAVNFWELKPKNTHDKAIIDMFKEVEKLLDRQEKLEGEGKKFVPLPEAYKNTLKTMITSHAEANIQ